MSWKRARSRNCINEEIKRRSNSRNSCYHSAHNLRSSHFVSKNLRIKVYKYLILPVILYGCETSSVTLREGHRLTIFENRMLKRIFGHKREEMVRGSRSLHNEELLNLYASPNVNKEIKSRSMRWAGHVERKGEMTHFIHNFNRKT
jgi:hypothetical protein